MTERLVAIADRTIMGEIRRDRRGRLAFFYDDHWRSLDAAYLLSLSMPLVVAEHGHARIEPWLWGLLPDNEFILARWFGVGSPGAAAGSCHLMKRAPLTTPGNELSIRRRHPRRAP